MTSQDQVLPRARQIGGIEHLTTPSDTIYFLEQYAEPDLRNIRTKFHNAAGVLRSSGVQLGEVDADLAIIDATKLMLSRVAEVALDAVVATGQRLRSASQ